MDNNTTITDLKDRVRQFCEQRDWDQFHAAKELAIGMITEASELLVQFRFLDEQQEQALLAQPDSRQEIEDELADVLLFVLRFAQRFDFDLAEAVTRKMQKNAERYPVEKSRGRNAKYSDL